jgi:hypothetical protein
LNEKVARGKQIIDELVNILSDLSDPQIAQLLGKGEVSNILKAILDETKLHQYPNIAEFLLDNKNRAHLLALLRYVITRNYSFKGTKEGHTAFVTPHYNQWIDDGVLFLEGEKPWEGLLGLYRKGQLSYAVASRDVKAGESFDEREFFVFVSAEDARERLRQIPPKVTSLDEPLNELNGLLNTREADEEKYHSWFKKYPWAFGLAYQTFQDLRPLDDKSIPDFTGIRHDGSRDIFEIKQPFLELFREDGEFRSEFNEAWNRAERYLDFTRRNEHYLLQEKGMRFSNPKCHLVAGYDLSDEQRKRIGIKERSTPSIEFRTYNDVLVLVSSVISFIKRVKNSDLTEHLEV